jgi:perosamine synthetase
MTDFIPVSEPLLTGNEKRYVDRCLETGWISSEGSFVTDFEERFAAKVGRRFGIAVCNGSAALQVAVSALELGEGDEVILPTFTIISCAAAILRCGARPVVIDCDPATWNMDVARIEAKITPRTKAIMPVHIYGLPVDMYPLLALAEKHGLKVIEDAAEMLGQTYDGRPCGSFGDLSAFSFYPNKHVTTGEGGMVVTDSEPLAARCRDLRNLCFQPSRRFVHEDLGWNFRMGNLQAALGLAQLEQLDEHVARKRRIGERYTALLGNLQGIDLPLPRTAYAENIYWVYGVVLGDAIALDAEAAMQALNRRGIGTRPFFWPMHEQPVLRKMGYFGGESCPVAENLARRGFYLPSGATLTEEQISRVAATLGEVLS